MRIAPYRFFYDRNNKSINGVLTLQDLTGKKLFDRLPTRSGQPGFENSNWTRGQSPIPKGVHTMWLLPKNRGQVPTGAGIGEFWPIGGPNSSSLIEGPVGRRRFNIGLHFENAYAGSAGCVVLLQDTAIRLLQGQDLFKLLAKLAKQYDVIEFNVI